MPWGTAPQHFISHSHSPSPSCSSPAVGSRASCPAHRDTSSGTKLSASSSCKEKPLLSASLAFLDGSLQGLKSHRRDRGHVVGDMEEGRMAALIWTMDQRLWFRLSAAALELSSKPKATPAEGNPPFSLILFLLGEPLSRLSHTSSGKETSDSLIAGSLCQAIAWRTTPLWPGSG